MSEFKKQRDDEQQKVRKLLQDLPDVQATNDFEMRLQRRIAEGRTKKSILDVFHVRPIPAFAYSLLVLVLVGALSFGWWYYWLQEPTTVVVEPTEKISPVPSEGKTENELTREHEKSLGTDGKTDRTDAVQFVTPSTEAGGVSWDAAVQEDVSPLIGNKQEGEAGAEMKMIAPLSRVPASKSAPQFHMETLAVPQQDTTKEDSLTVDSLQRAKKLLTPIEPEQ